MTADMKYYCVVGTSGDGKKIDHILRAFDSRHARQLSNAKWGKGKPLVLEECFECEIWPLPDRFFTETRKQIKKVRRKSHAEKLLRYLRKQMVRDTKKETEAAVLEVIGDLFDRGKLSRFANKYLLECLGQKVPRKERPPLKWWVAIYHDRKRKKENVWNVFRARTEKQAQKKAHRLLSGKGAEIISVKPYDVGAAWREERRIEKARKEGLERAKKQIATSDAPGVQ